MDVNFVHVADAPFETLWWEARAGQQQITAWAGGPLAALLSDLPQPALVRAALQSLARATSQDLVSCSRRLREAHCHATRSCVAPTATSDRELNELFVP